MTYAVNGVVQASDLDSLINAGSPNVNELWATGTGNRGYGQSPLSAPNAGNVVLASDWDSPFTTITTMADHQGTSITPLSSPQPNQVIEFQSSLSPNLTDIYNNRLNAAAQGSTSVPVNGSAVSVISWSQYLQFTFNIQFASNDALRYFFNAGGQMSLNFSHPSAGPTYPHNFNYEMSILAAEAGTIWLSSPTSGTVSLSGLNWNGVTQIGGTYPAGSTVYPNLGFYALTGVSQTLFEQVLGNSYYSYSAYSSTFLRVSASTNGSGLLTFVVLFDELPDGITLTPGTTSTLNIRYPSTTYLSNSWGTPAVTNSIVGA